MHGRRADTAMSSAMISPLHRFLARLQALSPLSAADHEACLDLPGDIIQARANLDIVKPGDDCGHCYLVLEGIIGRFTQFRDGHRQITAMHIPGDMADVNAIAAPVAASPMQALTTSTLIRYPLAELRSLARSRPALGEAFWAYAAIDAATVALWAANLGTRKAKQRMAHLLCELGLRFEASGRGDRRNFTLDLTQGQLGEALGLTPVHVNRTLKALRAEGIVEFIGRDCRVGDWDALAKVGDFDRHYLKI
jgi:CRP-like cAMP-binding protein